MNFSVSNGVRPLRFHSGQAWKLEIHILPTVSSHLREERYAKHPNINNLINLRTSEKEDLDNGTA